MVWGCMSSHGVGRLHIVSGTVKAMDYIEILQNKLLPTARYLLGNQSLISQDDNVPCHRAKVVQKWLEDHTVNRMNWPGQSPDLNPIESLWFKIDYEISKKKPSSNKSELIEALIFSFSHIVRKDPLLKLVHSMPKRCRAKLEEGRSVTSVAAEFGIAHSIVSRLWRQFQTTGTAIRGFSSGRPRGTTPADDRYIVLQARRNRRQTAGEIARHTTQATGRPISRFTVAKRLHGGGLFARRPVRCVTLTPVHRRRRSLWCREHRNWRDNEWGRILFTDERRFSLSSDSHRILIWRERGSRNHPSNIIERDRYGGRGVLVWGGIMLGSRTDLHIFDAGSVNGTRYCNEILLPYVRLFRGAMGLQFLFMDDNAPCHRTVAAEQLLESEDIVCMDWPARSPDLNPIEHVCDFLGRRLAARTLPPVTIRELRLALQDEWAAMPRQLIDTLILSMGRRCETCLAVRGDHIPY
ncbi:transposable element Tcb2 transposase [Trichonephila clavipes]|uniref:Transposable element Tcb2 transposase n=1 Tax=Trichonephila clavipes TaxID=2585209 RepID=A0A8X6RLA0_TRICX|nr:transposable element Tcb2 transposase [Trichonephila clavipes]